MSDRVTLAAHPLRPLAAVCIGLLMCGYACAADLTLYSKKHYDGHSLKIRSDQRNLSALGFNDRVSSVEIKKGAWQLCSGTDYDGKCVTLDPGRYPSLEDLGLEDKISSVRRAGSGNYGHHGNGQRDAVVLYKKENYSGSSHTIYDRESNLHDVGFNDKASSVKIRYGRWDFCSANNFHGDCVTLGPGRYPSLKRMGLNDRISSVRRTEEEWGHDHNHRDDDARRDPAAD